MIPLREVMARMPELEAFAALLDDPNFPTPEQRAKAAAVLARAPEDRQQGLDLDDVA